MPCPDMGTDSVHAFQQYVNLYSGQICFPPECSFEEMTELADVGSRISEFLFQMATRFTTKTGIRKQLVEYQVRK